MSFVISAAYQWPKKSIKESDKDSELAIKHIVNMISNRFNGKSHKNKISYKIDYRRLRASAGNTMLDSIMKRIENSNVIVFDITVNNPNIFLELGIALNILKNKQNLNVYLIKKNQNSTEKSLLMDLPSDLQGYFISEYEVKNNKVTFKDSGSLRMSLEGDIKEFYNSISNNSEEINEIDQ